MAQIGPPGIWKEDGPWKLYVSVLSATNLPDPKNPYVKLVVTSQPNQERLTRKVNGGKCPGWYQEYEFNLDNSQRQLSVSILDPRRIGSDAVVAEKAFPLGELVDGIERDEWLTMQRAGRLHLKILVAGPNAVANQKEISKYPSIGPTKKGPAHNFEEKKFKGAELCRGCKAPLKSKLWSKAYECPVCLMSICLVCYQSFDLNVKLGCKKAEKKLDAQMSQNVMNFYLNYTGRDKSGVLIVHSLPQEWKQLFKSAGVKPKELKNPDTVIALLQAWDEHTASNPGGNFSGGAVGQSSSPPAAAAPLTGPKGEPVLCRAEAKYDYEAAQEDDLTLHVGDIVLVLDKLHNGWWSGACKGVTGFFPGGFVEELPEVAPPPLESAPPPPPPSAPAPPAGGGIPPPPPPGPAPSSGGGIPPPPPPGGGPPPPPGGGPPPPPGPPPPGGGGLSGISGGASGLKKTNGPQPSTKSSGGGEGRGDLLDAIRQGKQLKTSEKPPPKAPVAAPADSGGGALLNVLSATIEKRREQLAAEGMDQDDGDDGDWDDWD